MGLGIRVCGRPECLNLQGTNGREITDNAPGLPLYFWTTTGLSVATRLSKSTFSF